jgi:hypothetical protein
MSARSALCSLSVTLMNTRRVSVKICEMIGLRPYTADFCSTTLYNLEAVYKLADKSGENNIGKNTNLRLHTAIFCISGILFVHREPPF